MTDAAEDTIKVLHKLVLDDPALQLRLFDLSDARDLVAAVLRLAQSSGYKLAEEDVLHAMRIGRKAWSDRKLP